MDRDANPAPDDYFDYNHDDDDDGPTAATFNDGPTAAGYHHLASSYNQLAASHHLHANNHLAAAVDCLASHQLYDAAYQFNCAADWAKRASAAAQLAAEYTSAAHRTAVNHRHTGASENRGG